MLIAILFYLAAAGLLAGALGVVLAKSTLRAAMALIASLCSLALLFVLLEASFVAAMQLLVYAGAIMVLFVFVIMLLNLQPGATPKPTYVSISKALGALGVLYLLFVIADRSAVLVFGAAGGAVDGTVKNIGNLLLSKYLFGFEAISLLLLTAVVGAVVLGKKRLA